MRRELILSTLLLAALAGWAHRVYRYEQLVRHVATKECVAPPKPLRPYPLELET